LSLRRTLRRLGRTLPREWMIVLVVVACAVMEILKFWTIPAFGPERDQFLLIRDAILIAAAAAYGFHRVASFHPIFHTDYRDWLAGTPWTRSKPLPLGPLRLVWQDVLIVGLLCLAQYDAIAHRALVPTAFCIGYHAAMAIACVCTTEKAWAYVLGFLTALIVRLLVDPLYALVAGVALYGVSLAAIRAMLDGFPWENAYAIKEMRKRLAARQHGQQRKRTSWTEVFVRDGLDERLGWPFGVIDTHDPGIQVSRLDGFLASLLVGWWVHALLALIPQEPGGFLGFMVMAYLLIGGVGGRLGIYCAHYRPPISFWGRIATGRLFIRGYDQVWIGPLATLVAGMAIPLGGVYANLPASLYMPAAFVITLSLLVGAEPSLRGWRTTGNHRIVPGTLNKQKFLEH
jgi:hypothetical protein